MAIFQLIKNKLTKLEATKFKSEKQLQNLLEKNLEEILGVTFLATEFETTNGGRIDSLGLDENNAPVIIEYKESEKDNVINQGLFYMDWLIDHKGDFEMLIRQKIGKVKEINWDEPRLILIAQSFNEYDKYAVNRISENIELWKYNIYKENIMHIERINLTKKEKDKKQKESTKVVFKEYTLNHHLKDKNKEIKALFKRIQEEITAIDEQIQERYKKYYVAYTLDKNFCEIVVQANGLKIYLDIEKSKLNDPKKMAKDCSVKGHWATGDCEVKVTSEDEIKYVRGLIKQSYETKL